MEQVMSMTTLSELPNNFTGTLEKMVARGIELTVDNYIEFAKAEEGPPWWKEREAMLKADEERFMFEMNTFETFVAWYRHDRACPW
jgi:hypothetical protein